MSYKTGVFNKQKQNLVFKSLEWPLGYQQTNKTPLSLFCGRVGGYYLHANFLLCETIRFSPPPPPPPEL